MFKLNSYKVKCVLVLCAYFLYGLLKLLLGPLWVILYFFSPNDIPYKEGRLLFLHYPKLVKGKILFWKYVYFVEYYMGDTSIREVSNKEIEEALSAQRHT